MKKIFTLLFLLAAILSVKAQERTQKNFVSDKYDRSSISVIILEHDDHYDNIYVPCIPKLRIDPRFDVNDIPPSVRVSVPRDRMLAKGELTKVLNQAQVGKSVVSYLYNRKSDGSFDDKVVKERGVYNQSLKDMNIALTSITPSDSLILGEKLLDDCYVLVMDICPRADTLRVMTSLFKLAWDEDLMTDFYSNAWSDASDADEVKASRGKAFDAMNFPLVHVKTSVSDMIEWDPSSNQMSWVQRAYTTWEEVTIEQMDKFQVASAVVATTPVEVRIGTKEGVRNGRRYGVYSYRETADGELHSKRQAYLRATKVGRNYSDPSVTSLFYQISGAPMAVREGMIVKERQDMRTGLSAMYQVGGLSDAIVAELEYLTHIGRHGCKTYTLVDFGYGLKRVEAYTNYRCSVGAGYGIPVTRFLELAPYATVGVDIFDSKDSTYDELQFDSRGKLNIPGAYYVEPGVRLGVVVYPVSIVAKLNYQLMVSEGMSGYDYINENYFENQSGVAAQIGIKYNF